MPRIGRSRRRSTPKRSIWDCRPARPRWSGARRRSRRNGAVTDFAHIRIDRHEGGIAAVVVARADIGNASSPELDRKSGVSGKSVSVRVDLGGRRIIKKKQRKTVTYLEYKIKEQNITHIRK